jgi:hypothetical protein
VPWYQKAASQGSLEAVHKLGNILLTGATGLPMDKSVKADSVTGIQLIFLAATNRYTTAYYDMYRAYRDGLGVPKDVLQSYAWLQLDVDSTPRLLGNVVHQNELNRLALDVDVATSQAGKQLAAQYKSGHWPVLVIQPPAAPKPATAATPPKPSPKPAPNLVLSGIVTGKTPVAVINGKSLAVGQTTTIVIKPETYTIKCLRIYKDCVSVSVDGESQPHELHLK